MDAAALRRDGRYQQLGHRLDARLDLPVSRRFRLAEFARYPVQLASSSHGRLAYRPLRSRYGNNKKTKKQKQMDFHKQVVTISSGAAHADVIVFVFF